MEDPTYSVKMIDSPSKKLSDPVINNNSTLLQPQDDIEDLTYSVKMMDSPSKKKGTEKGELCFY